MKKNNLYGILVILLLSLLLAACSSTTRFSEKKEAEAKVAEEVKKDNPAFITTDRMHSWVNLMPNSGERFHITGEVTLSRKSIKEFKNAEIFRIVVFHKNKELYQILPKIIVDEKKTGDKKKVFIFSTLKGMTTSPELDYNEPVTLEIHISDGDNLFKYISEELTVEKIY